MRFGEDIFLRMTADFSELKKYGFSKNGSDYFFSKNFMQNEFKAEIKVDSKGKLTGKVIELETNEEYLPIHIESYIGAPVSAILYKCEITATDIPYDYLDENIRITHLMRIKRLKKYKRTICTFKKLNELGINAVRGPRLATKTFLDYIESC